jgi:hypothetical protein
MYQTLQTDGDFDSRDPEVRAAIDWADSVLPPAEPNSTFLDRLFGTKHAGDDFEDRWNHIPTDMNMPPWRDIYYRDYTGSSPVPTHYNIRHPNMREFNTRSIFEPTAITDDSDGLVLRAANRQFRLRNMWFSEAMLFTYAVHTEYVELLTKEKLAGQKTESVGLR